MYANGYKKENIKTTQELNIVVNGNQLNNVENEKLLGVHIDNNLAFKGFVWFPVFIC